MINLSELINFKPNIICEVGVHKPHDLRFKNFILDEEINFILVEANPRCYDLLKSEYSFPNVKIFNNAICDFNGKIKLYNRGSDLDASAFIDGLPYSPAIINDNYNKYEADSIICDGITFDKIDTGNIDILTIDIEGAEWFVLKYLKSLPKLICIETHGSNYINPYMNLILEWMHNNNYSEAIKDQSDTIYLYNG